ncbi:hypothetical protein NQ317_014421 [Molorchus minor]|uniref:Glycoprotein endo-alpha-1,2-mannosidase n=1 Tax=Molorchus minor TaxID=1323400 RepID=A0ABQ9K5N5_9CUCU|nr:hypothetical protein NQ317_014421 [Molorchus minor]
MLTLTIRKYYILSLLVGVIILFMVFSSNDINNYEEKRHTTTPTYSYFSKNANKSNDLISNEIYSDYEINQILMKQKIARLEKKYQKTQSIVLNSKSMMKPNYNIHIFYYAWYGNIIMDGKYKHWNHQYMENWKKDDRKKYPRGRHRPPDDIGSNYYPLLGCYSSSESSVIDEHLRQISEAGVGVIVVSWTPPNLADTPYKILPKLLNTALKYNVKISIQVEPYIGRNPINLITHLKQFFKEYNDHSALYKIRKPLSEKMVPVIYIYDSYLIPSVAWRELFSSKGNLSVRNTTIDAIYLGLLVDLQHKYHIKKSQFDGFYTYFATNSFTYGSTWKNWRHLAKFANQNGLIFIPSVGPGYIDTRVRPWNVGNTRHRRHGQYYDVAWRAAVNNKVNYISITSFNEWHEGTQIEPARSKVTSSYTYLDYEPEGSYYYLNLTKSWVIQFEKLMG